MKYATCADCTFLRPLAVTVPPSKPYCLRYPRPVVRMPGDTACGELSTSGVPEEIVVVKPSKLSKPTLKPADSTVTKEGRKKPDGA